ncbi:hypothetical protein [Dongia sp. agr-C8]
MDSTVLLEQQRPNQRLWRDLSKMRLFLALGFAPLPPFILGFLLIKMWVGTLPIGIITVFGGILAAAEVWSMLAGTVFLLVLAWMRGALRRGDCLLLGVLLAFTLPFAAFLADAGVDWLTGATAPEAVSWDDLEGPSNRSAALFISIVLIPFGALGGWIFWRVGVRPAQSRPIDVAPVFD